MAKVKDYKQELLVAGFVRELQMVYKIKKIPKEIIDIIYIYQHFCDKWNKKHSFNDITIDEIRNSITFNTEGISTAYGSIQVEDGIIKWKIKIISTTRDEEDDYPFIGIIKDNEHVLDHFKDDDCWESHGYQFCGGTGKCNGMDRAKQRLLQIRWNKQIFVVSGL